MNAATEKVYMTMGRYGPDGERVLVNSSGYEVVAGFTAEEIRDDMVANVTSALEKERLHTATSTSERDVDGHQVDLTTLTWSDGQKFFEFWIERGDA